MNNHPAFPTTFCDDDDEPTLVDLRFNPGPLELSIAAENDNDVFFIDEERITVDGFIFSEEPKQAKSLLTTPNVVTLTLFVGSVYAMWLSLLSS